MKPKPNVGAHIHNPNYDVLLSEIEGSKEIGLILCNQHGVSDRRGMVEAYNPRTAMQIAQGYNTYDDIELPYSVEVQSSMIGGRGIDDFPKDKTRYADGFRMDTSGTNPICGPDVLEQYGYRETNVLFNEPENGLWYTLDPSAPNNKVDWWSQIQITGEKSISGLYFYVKGFTGKRTIYYDAWVGSAPASLRFSRTIYGNGMNQWVHLPINPKLSFLNSILKWTIQTDKRIFVQYAKAPGGEIWGIFPPGTPLKKQRTNVVLMSGFVSETDSDYKFFEYKRGMYMMKRGLDRSGSAIYRNGYRGLAKPNTNQLHLLRTNYANLPDDSLKGAVVLITGGPGEMENQPWREIVSNTQSDIQVSSPWKIPHTAETEYVIVGTNVWTQVETPTLNNLTITDAQPLEDYIVFAFGDDKQLGYYREGKSLSGPPAWVGEWIWDDSNINRYHYLTLTQDGEGKLQLWAANANSCEVSYCEPPQFYELSADPNNPIHKHPVFDIWKEERYNLNLSLERIIADIAEAKGGAERLRLQRLKEDAQSELVDINRAIARLTADIASYPAGGEILRLDRLLEDANREKTGLLKRKEWLEADIAGESDADKKKSLQRELWEVDNLHIPATTTSITRIEADRTKALSNQGDDMKALIRLKEDAEVEKVNTERSITRLEYDIANLENTSEVERLERMKVDVEYELEKLKTFIQAGDTSSHITNILIYGAPGIPFIMKETEVGSIYNNVYSKIPIAEIESVRSEVNGRAAMAYGVYLYFNLEGGWIERYYDQQMNDVSPNRDEGLPIDRQGEISKLMPYAGRWYASVNAGYSGVSSVLLNNELGWHEIYRSPGIGLPITDIYVQAIPGVSNADQLWIAESQNVKAIPIAISPTKQINYAYYGYNVPKEEAPYVETAWLDFGYKDVNKYFHSLKLFVDMPGVTIRSGYEYLTHVWFKTDKTPQDEWIFIGTRDASQEIQNFGCLINGLTKAWGKQIKFKIAMQSRNKFTTPRLKAWVCDGVIRFEVKKQWQLTFQLQPDTDLTGKKIQMKNDNEIYNLLDKWANSVKHAIPLRMRTNDPNSDDKLVFIDPASIQRKTVSLSINNTGGSKEFVNVASLVAYEN